jgi:hypothetical protein
MTNRQIENIKREGIIKDSCGFPVLGGDTIIDDKGNKFTAIWQQYWCFEAENGKIISLDEMSKRKFRIK